MTNAEKIRLIGIACRAHRSAGSNFASLAYEAAIFDAGYAAALADAANEERDVTEPRDYGYPKPL